MATMEIGMRIELACVEDVIENEIAQGAKQKDVAETYAMALVSSWPTDWPRVNRAIAARWPKGLQRIKEKAWAIARARSKPKEDKA
jgi:hypothetical protein